MHWKVEDMDLVLVPSGLLIMFVYHLRLLYRCIRLPETTVIGYENHCRSAWVENMLKIKAEDRGQCKDVISSTISATTFLASMSLILGSLMGTWVASSSTTNIFKLKTIYGSTSPDIISVKYISILACFLAAFAAFLQSARHYIHANFLITMPVAIVPVEQVQREVLRGCAYWSLGLRAIYFAINLLMWIFGPVTFLFSSVVMVVLLYVLDGRTPDEFHDYVMETEENNPNIFKRVVEGVMSHSHHRNRTRNGQSQDGMANGFHSISMQDFAAS